MKYPAFFIIAAASVFCAGLFAQEHNPDAAPTPASPDSRAGAPAPFSASPAPVPALQPDLLSRAGMAATRWLAVVDTGNYPLSWQPAADLLQTAVSQPTWENALQTGRLPRGGLKSRLVQSATSLRTLAGAPDREYVLIQYDTRFKFKPQAIETLTTGKESEDSWKLAGYFIK